MNNITFVGYVESNNSFMLGAKILGVCKSDSYWYIGFITGDINDIIENAHDCIPVGNIIDVNTFLHSISMEKKTSFKFTKSTYLEACKKMYLNMPKENVKEFTIGKETIAYDLTSFKKKLLKAIENE